MNNKVIKEELKTRRGTETMEIIHGATNKLFSHKPTNAISKLSVFVGDICGVILTEDDTIEIYTLSYEDGAYGYEGSLEIPKDENIKCFLKREAIKAFNQKVKKAEQIIDDRYIKKILLGLQYL